jgi:hypothetical protein
MPIKKYKESRQERIRLEKIDREINPETYEHTTKECSRCHLERKWKEFPPYENQCLECKSDQNKTRRLKDPALATWTAAKHRARSMGIEFSITIEDVRAVWTDTCPVFLIPLKQHQNKAMPDSFSLDRIDNSKGYVPGNIAIVSMKFNTQKRDLTADVLRRMLAYVEGRLLP